MSAGPGVRGFEVGDGAKIGSNAVVIKPVPAGPRRWAYSRRSSSQQRARRRRDHRMKVHHLQHHPGRRSCVSQALRGLIDSALARNTRCGEDAVRPAFRRCSSAFQRLGNGLGLAWQVMMRQALPRTTATWRERMAVGTNFRLIWRICSPKPAFLCGPRPGWPRASHHAGRGRCRRWSAPGCNRRSTSSISVALMVACSSGMRRASN